MTEPGSDEQLERYADLGALRRGVREDNVRRAIEEWRVSHAPLSDDEPGEQHPDPGPPPPTQPHDEYDPTPPKEPR